MHGRVRVYETMLLCDARRDDAEIEQTIGRFTAGDSELSPEPEMHR